MVVVPVNGYESLYSISDDGRIFGKKSGKELVPYLSKQGYLRVKLYKDSKPKMFMVHRLVADAFIPNPEKKSQVNHIDGIKTNNNVKNLEWVTQRENQIHAHKNGLNSTKHAVESNKKRVVQKTVHDTPIKTWESMSDAGRALNIAVSNITHCCRGRIRHAGGYRWEYI